MCEKTRVCLKQCRDFRAVRGSCFACGCFPFVCRISWWWVTRSCVNVWSLPEGVLDCVVSGLNMVFPTSHGRLLWHPSQISNVLWLISDFSHPKRSFLFPLNVGELMSPVGRRWLLCVGPLATQTGHSSCTTGKVTLTGMKQKIRITEFLFLICMEVF